MKIGVIGDTFMIKGTGSGSYLSYLFKYLLKLQSEDLKIVLILNKNKKRNKIPFDNCEVIYVSKFPIIKDFQLLSLDWIILNGISIKSPLYFKINRLVIIHGGYELTNSKLKGYLSKKYWRNILLLRSKINMTVSESSKKLLETNLFKNKFHVNHCGVDHEIFKQIKKKKFSCNNYNLEDGEYIFHLSRYVPRKNSSDIFDVFKKIKERPSMSKLKLVIGGNGWGNEIENFLNQNDLLTNDIIYLGFINSEDLPILYSNALAFLFFSKYEGFGMPLMEAMSCKCITIANNKYSLPEIALPESVFSLKKDKIKIVDYIENIYLNIENREFLQEKNFLKFLEFDWNFAAMNVINLIKNG